MKSSFNFGRKTTIAAAIVFGLIGSTAFAQNSIALDGNTVTPSTRPTPSPTPLPNPNPNPYPNPIGITVNGWQQSSGIGQGYNTGGDGKGTVATLADGFFQIGAETYLTGNSNSDCKADCRDTQAKLWIKGEQLAGARSTNQGTGNSPVSSVAGTNGIFNASLKTQWQFTPPPVATTKAP